MAWDSISLREVKEILLWMQHDANVQNLDLTIGEARLVVHKGQREPASAVVVLPAPSTVRVPSPYVGRFHRRVEDRSAVEAETVVGEVETLKSRRPVPAGACGRISFVASDGTTIGYSDTVATISPDVETNA